MEKITFKSINEYLVNVDFNNLNDAKNNSIKPLFSDTITRRNVNGDGFELLFTRKISFEPSSIFQIEVVFCISCQFTDESINFYKGDLSEISKFIDKRQIEIIESTKAISKTSLIIASLSNISKNTPLVTPPRIIKNE